MVGQRLLVVEVVVFCLGRTMVMIYSTCREGQLSVTVDDRTYDSRLVLPKAAILSTGRDYQIRSD